jgi:hypothetical protein
MEIKDIRPISLVGGIYKIISKTKTVLDNIISSSNKVFIRGRQILDSVLVANKCLDSRIRYGEPSVLGKLDLEKVYDHVN